MALFHIYVDRNTLIKSCFELIISIRAYNDNNNNDKNNNC